MTGQCRLCRQFRLCQHWTRCLYSVFELKKVKLALLPGQKAQRLRPQSLELAQESQAQYQNRPCCRQRQYSQAKRPHQRLK